MTADKLAEIADSNIEKLEAQPSVEESTEKVETQPAGDSKTDDRATTTPDANTVLTELRGRIERGELKVEDLPQDLLPADARKVQSSFAKKIAGIERGVARAEEALRAVGVTPPEGKSVLDLITEDGGKGFQKMLEGTIQSAVEPLKRQVDIGEMQTNINAQLKATVADHPDLTPLLPEIGRIIESTPRLGAYVANVEAIPDIVLAVGRDLQYQAEKAKSATLARENERLTKILKDAKIAITSGASTSRAGGKTPSSVTDGAEPKPKGFDAIASAVFDRISNASRAN